MELVLATNNASKVKEMTEILSVYNIKVISQKDAGVNLDVEETGITFEENATIKARAIYNICKKPVFADDSGLEVDYLGNAPGVFSHRYAGENATDVDRYRKLLAELDGVKSEERTARFVCAICYIDENGEETTLRGECHGTIGFEPLGDNGFGYDPVFMYGEKSFAELSAEEKNTVSHRANALKKFVRVIGNSER